MKVAGIDVSSKTVTLVISHGDRTTKPREFKNTPQGHVALINRLRQAQVSRVCLEATGQYHLDLALDDVGLDVMVINPKAALCQGDANLHQDGCRRCCGIGSVRLAHALHALAAPMRRPWRSAPLRAASRR